MFYRYQIFSLSNVYLFKKEIQSISVAYILAGQKRGWLRENLIIIKEEHRDFKSFK